MPVNIDDFNKAAEYYFRNHPDKEHFERKPFHSMDETPSILLRLGIILQNLYIGPSHRVVDFGAGSCWLSLILNKLKIITFSVDVSVSALNIGKNMFKLDPYANPDVEHHFIEFDGYHIDLPDSSIDRIICFDAYHHLPNTQTILSEFARILVPGGIAAFAEPGEEHSKSLKSLSEINTFGVLENDVSLVRVWEEAQKCGFTTIKIFPINSSAGMALDLCDYDKYLAGDDSLFPHKQNRLHLYGGQVFFLYKGDLIIDSRSPARLLASISLQNKVPNKVMISQPVSVSLKITNMSECLWLAHHFPHGGFVQVGAHLEKIITTSQNSHTEVAKYEMISYDFLRIKLPHDIKPNESFLANTTFTLPKDPGHYKITFDLVDEFIRWFEQDGSKTLVIEIEAR